MRVGLEDHLWMDSAKTDAATNVRLIERVARVAESGDEPSPVLKIPDGSSASGPRRKERRPRCNKCRADPQ